MKKKKKISNCATRQINELIIMYLLVRRRLVRNGFGVCRIEIQTVLNAATLVVTATTMRLIVVAHLIGHTASLLRVHHV